MRFLKGNMAPSRRKFLKNAAATATVASVPVAAKAAESRDDLAFRDQLICQFGSLPGDKAWKIYAPEAGGEPRLLIQSESSKMLFVASAIKTFVLCEALR